MIKPIVARSTVASIRLTVGVLGGLAAVALVLAGYLWALPDFSAIELIAGLLALAGLAVATIVYAVAEHRAYSVTLTDRDLVIHHLHRTRHIPREDIFGWRAPENGDAALLYLHYGSERKRKALIGVGYLDNPALGEALRAYPDLDLAEETESTEEWLNDARNGTTRDQREASLRHQNRTALALNVTGVVVAGWLFLGRFPVPAVILNLLIPPVALGLAAVMRDRWTYGAGQPKDARPSIGYFYAAPIIALAMYAILLLDTLPILDPLRWTATIAGLAAAIYGLSCALIRSQPRASKQHALLIGVVAIYAISGVTLTNFLGGRTLVDIQQVEILERVDGEDATRLTLAPWGQLERPVSIETNRPAPVGAKVKVFDVRGFLGLRYWTVRGPTETDETPPKP